MDNLSSEAQKAIEDLRMRVKEVLNSDMYNDNLLFYRFLKARDFDVDESEKMLRKHMVWRKVFQVDTILEDFKPKEFFTKRIEPTILGYDKEGDLTLYFPGNLEVREVLKCIEYQNYIKYWVWYVEKCVSSLKPLNKGRGITNARQMTAILDLDKVTFGNVTYKLTAEAYLTVTNNFQNNYPEYMKAIYVINAPAYALPAVAIVKAVLSNVMLEKIHFFGHDGWKEKLLEVIDANVLPAFLGGNRTDSDGDPLCKSFVNHGGHIPPEYYITSEEKYLKGRTDVKSIIVPNREKKEISVDVIELESIVRWEFYCKSNVGFGLFRKHSNQELEEVIPISQYDTSDGAVKDSFKARSIGKYIIVFDNTHSWLSSKEVQYCIKLINPEANC